MTDPTILSVIFTGMGTALGAGSSYIINALRAARKTKAEAADVITEAAGNITIQFDRLNQRLDRENQHMRHAIILLTEVVDRIIPLLVNVEVEMLQTLKDANSTAKRAAFKGWIEGK